MESAARHPVNLIFENKIFRVTGLLILAAMLLAPIWTVAFPPLLDYPNHLARAFVLAHLNDSHFSFREFYRSDWGAYPYLGMDASLAVLGRIFPIETAGRVYLSLCALALPGAAWFFLRQAQPKSDAGCLWALLIAYNVFFLEGFLNFDLSIAVGFVRARIYGCAGSQNLRGDAGLPRLSRSRRCTSRTCSASASPD